MKNSNLIKFASDEYALADAILNFRDRATLNDMFHRAIEDTDFPDCEIHDFDFRQDFDDCYTRYRVSFTEEGVDYVVFKFRNNEQGVDDALLVVASNDFETPEQVVQQMFADSMRELLYKVNNKIRNRPYYDEDFEWFTVDPETNMFQEVA